jgi:hypothetical protein
MKSDLYERARALESEYREKGRSVFRKDVVSDFSRTVRVRLKADTTYR